MIKIDPEKPEPAKTDAKPKHDETAGSAAPNESQQLADDTEALCVDLEKFFRRAFGEMPKSTELGEIRAQQAAVRNLVRRAADSGSGSSEQVAALTAERDKLKDTAARARADFLNYQSRSVKELERAEELSLRKYVSDLLPILDSMDLALQDARSEKAEVGRLKDAQEMIATSMQQALQVRGLERIEAKGKPFDPNLHEAVAKRPADPAAGEKPNTVLEELRSGYLWKGLLLRPAQVLVADKES